MTRRNKYTLNVNKCEQFEACVNEANDLLQYRHGYRYILNNSKFDWHFGLIV